MHAQGKWLLPAAPALQPGGTLNNPLASAWPPLFSSLQGGCATASPVCWHMKLPQRTTTWRPSANQYC